ELTAAGFQQSDDEEKPRRGELAVMTAMEMSAACGQIIDSVKQGTIRHLEQQPLDAAVAGAQTRELADAIAWTRKNSSVDISPVVVATEARWVFEDRAHRVLSNDYDIGDSLW